MSKLSSKNASSIISVGLDHVANIVGYFVGPAPISFGLSKKLIGAVEPLVLSKLND